MYEVPLVLVEGLTDAGRMSILAWWRQLSQQEQQAVVELFVPEWVEQLDHRLLLLLGELSPPGQDAHSTSVCESFHKHQWNFVHLYASAQAKWRLTPLSILREPE